ncbi:hypothetical protein D3C71_1842130 [compost metagenome]
MLKRLGTFHLAVDADPPADPGQLRPQGSNHLGKLALKEQDLAIEGVQHISVFLGRIARAHRNPAQIGAPEA